MRNAFARVLTELAPKQTDLVLLYADIGNRLFNDLKGIAPERCINTGIAEAHMASMAAGLAKEGLKPLLYTIASFTSSRNFEQIKVDVAYQNLPVTIVGTGGGLSYANLGPTHHTFEDIALMRSLPNMQVVCPADANELTELLPQILASGRPTYLRIGKKNEPALCSTFEPNKLSKQEGLLGRVSHLKADTDGDSESKAEPISFPGEASSKVCLGAMRYMRSGADLLVVSTGVITGLALDLAEVLADKYGVQATVVNIHTIKPFDKRGFASLVANFETVLALEEHSIVGGLGSLLAEEIVDNEWSCRLIRAGLPDVFIDQVDSRESALEKAGLTVDALIELIKRRTTLCA